MDIRDMHMDFKMKYNKLDSNGEENLSVPEIDWLLNEAMLIYINTIAEPYTTKHGFEVNQRSIDAISPIVVRTNLQVSNKQKSGNYTLNYFNTPLDYFHFIKAICYITKSGCKEDNEAVVLLQQHDDMYRTNSFYDSSFEWREVVANFENSGLVLYSSDFDISYVEMVYIKKPNYIHNAEDFNPSIGYELPSGVLLTGRQHCIFSDDVCKDIVDIAVLLAAQNTGLVQQSNLMQNKLKLKQINNEYTK